MLDTKSKKAWTLRAARAGDLDAVTELMGACGLPAAGVADQFGERYVIAEKDGRIVGAAGLELHGGHGLLRSVAVAPPMRGSGLGADLVRERLEWASERGIDSVYLLTETAERYFARHGF